MEWECKYIFVCATRRILVLLKAIPRKFFFDKLIFILFLSIIFMQNKVVIIAGTSGSGKTTIANALLKKFPNMEKLITCTTREKRKDEVNGKDYRFVSKEQFQKYVENNELLEYEQYGKNIYGSLKKDAEKLFKKNKIILFVLEPKGAMTISKKFPNALTLFLKAPSLEELRKRFVIRGDSKEKADERIELVKRDLSFEKKFNHTIINDKLEEAISEAEKQISNFINK